MSKNVELTEFQKGLLFEIKDFFEPDSYFATRKFAKHIREKVSGLILYRQIAYLCRKLECNEDQLINHAHEYFKTNK